MPRRARASKILIRACSPLLFFHASGLGVLLSEQDFRRNADGSVKLKALTMANGRSETSAIASPAQVCYERIIPQESHFYQTRKTPSDTGQTTTPTLLPVLVSQARPSGEKGPAD